jgi:hypothetical protein
VTVYTFQPKYYEGPNLGGKFLQVIRDPIGTFVEDAAQHHDRAGKNAGVYPVQVDDEWDTVTVVDPGPAGALFGIGKPANKQNAATAQELLQKTYDTGVIQPGIPVGYRQFGADVAGIGAARLARPAPPAQPVIPATRTDTGQNFMGGFIPPGGVMGFAQMSPASQLALTRGARGTRRTTSRRRKKRSTRSKTRSTRKRSKRASGSKKRKLVKGSAAAKRYMAKIRRKRRK